MAYPNKEGHIDFSKETKEGEAKELQPGGKVDPVVLLLAGVVKFNSTLKRLTLSSGEYH